MMRRYINPIGLLIISVAACLHAKVFWDYTIDDAYISFRYAKNLVEGNGLVFNIGERVEGYTNFLWVLLMAVPEALHYETATFAKIVGLFSACICLVLTYLLGKRIFNNADGFPALAAPCVLALQSPFILWTVAGLETATGLMFFLAGILFYLKESKTPVFSWSAVFFFAAGLTRPDLSLGILVVLVLGGVGLIANCGNKYRNAALKSFLTLSILTVGYLAWKYFYYGSLLPNTFYAKAPKENSLLFGADYLWKFVLYNAFAPVLIFAGAPIISKRRMSLILPFSMIGVYWLYVLIVGGDWMPMLRFLIVTLPFYALLVQSFIADLSLRLEIMHKYHLAPKIFAAVLAIILAMPGLLMFQGLPRHKFYNRIIEQEKSWIQSYKLLGISMGRLLPKGTLVACDVAGAFPYYSNLRTIDLDGLTDAHIARYGKGKGRLLGKRDFNYVLDRSPEVIFLYPSINPFDNRSWSEEEVLDTVAKYMDDQDLRVRFMSEYRYGFWQVNGWIINAMIRQDFKPKTEN